MGIYQRRKTIRPDVPCVPCDGEGRVEATCYGVLGVAECEECRGTGEAQCPDCGDAADTIEAGRVTCVLCVAERLREADDMRRNDNEANAYDAAGDR